MDKGMGSQNEARLLMDIRSRTSSGSKGLKTLKRLDPYDIKKPLSKRVKNCNRHEDSFAVGDIPKVSSFNKSRAWTAFDCGEVDPINLGGIPDQIPIFDSYTEANLNTICINLAADLFKGWARPTLRQFNPLLPEITKSNANNTKKTICNKIKKVLKENPHKNFIPVLEVKKKLIEQWGSLVNRNLINRNTTVSKFTTPAIVSNSNGPTVTKSLTQPLHHSNISVQGLMSGGTPMSVDKSNPLMNPINPMMPPTTMPGIGMLMCRANPPLMMGNGMVNSVGAGMPNVICWGMGQGMNPLGGGTLPFVPFPSVLPIPEKLRNDEKEEPGQSEGEDIKAGQSYSGPTNKEEEEEEEEDAEEKDKGDEEEEEMIEMKVEEKKTEEKVEENAVKKSFEKSAEKEGENEGEGEGKKEVEKKNLEKKGIEEPKMGPETRKSNGETVETAFFAFRPIPENISDVDKQQIHLENSIILNIEMLAKSNSTHCSRIYVLQQHLSLQMTIQAQKQMAEVGMNGMNGMGMGMMMMPPQLQQQLQEQQLQPQLQPYSQPQQKQQQERPLHQLSKAIKEQQEQQKEDDKTN